MNIGTAALCMVTLQFLPLTSRGRIPYCCTSRSTIHYEMAISLCIVLKSFNLQKNCLLLVLLCGTEYSRRVHGTESGVVLYDTPVVLSAAAQKYR